MRTLALIIPLLLLFTAPALADILSWTDSQGTVHFTDDPGAIPAKYRKSVVRASGDDSDSEPQAAAPTTPAKTASSKRSRMADSGTEAADANDFKLRSRRQLSLDQDPSPEAALARQLLQQGPKTDREKAYAIFTWIYDHIIYDNSTKWQRRYGNSGGDQSPAGVLASGRAVCEGMANLFAAVAQKMGLESVVISGRAGGARQARHAWNAVKIDGTWGLLDNTRHTFLASPQEFLARHFPDDPGWQLVNPPLTYAEWLKR